MNSNRFAIAAAVLLFNGATAHAAVTIPDAIKVANNAQPAFICTPKASRYTNVRPRKTRLLSSSGRLRSLRRSSPTRPAKLSVNTMRARLGKAATAARPWQRQGARRCAGWKFNSMAAGFRQFDRQRNVRQSDQHSNVLPPSAARLLLLVCPAKWASSFVWTTRLTTIFYTAP